MSLKKIFYETKKIIMMRSLQCLSLVAERFSGFHKESTEWNNEWITNHLFLGKMKGANWIWK